MKKLLKISTTFVLVFTLLFTNLFSSVPSGILKDLFKDVPTTVQAEDTDYNKNLRHELHSNANMGNVAIKSLGHYSTTPFRKFYVEDKDLKSNKRVICGYSEGRGHPGDKYKKTVVSAVNWKSTTNKNALWGHNTEIVAKALKWFYDDVGVSNATTKQSYFIQTFVWAKTMGVSAETALRELASSKKWKYSDMEKMWDAVKKEKREGYIVIYENVGKCVQNVTDHPHQPYFRWFKITPKTDTVSAEKSKTIEDGIPLDVYKSSKDEKKPIAGVEVSVIYDGKTYTGKTNSEGHVYFKLPRKAVGSGKGSAKYVKNWDKLTTEQQNEYRKNGYWANKALAQKAANNQADSNAEKDAKAKLAKFNKTCKIVETKADGYFYKVGNTGKSITKTVTGTTSKLSASFVNQEKYGSIKIQKKVSGVYSNSFSLEGAEYTVKSGTTFSGNTVGKITITKDSKGNYVGSLGKIPVGKYSVKETKAPKGFELDSKIYTFEMVDNGGNTLVTKNGNDTINVIVSNEKPKTGSVTLVKWLQNVTVESDENGNQTTVKDTPTLEPGIKFILKATSKLNGDSPYTKGVEATTGEDGTVNWKDVPYGTYSLKMAEGQTLAKTITYVGPFTLKVQDNSEDKFSGRDIKLGITADDGVTVDQRIPPGSIAVHKTMSKTNREGVKETHPEAGAKFRVFDELGVVPITKTFTTDENGYARSEAIAEPGTYTLRQVSGRDSRYAKMEDKQFTITADDLDETKDPKIFEYTIDNEYLGDRIYLTKKKLPYDSEISTYDETKQSAESDAEFYVLDVSQLSDDVLKDVKENGSLWEASQRSEFVQNHNSAVLAKLVTDENGEASTDLDCTLDENGVPIYQIGEKGFLLLQTKGAEGYILTKPLFSSEDAKIEKKDFGHSFVWAADLVNRQEHPMAIAKFKKVRKSDSKGTTKPEAGAKFKVVKANGTYLQHDDEDIVCTADENGDVYIPWLDRGNYTLEQIDGSSKHDKITSSMDDYAFAVLEEDLVFNENAMEAFVKTGKIPDEFKDNVVEVGVNGTIVNEELPVEVSLAKYSTYTGVRIPRTEFTLYQKGDDGKYTELNKYYTDENGNLTIQGLMYGSYKIKETKAADGYLLSEKDTGIDSSADDFQFQEKEFTIDEDHVVEKDGVLHYSENGKDAFTYVFKDSPIFGKIAINKSGKVLTDFAGENTGFEYEDHGLSAVYGLYAGEDIYDDAGTLIWAKDTKISEATTDANNDGYAIFKNNGELEDPIDFYLGKYYVKELKAPDGYNLDEDVHEVLLTWQKDAKDSTITAWQPEDSAETGQNGSTGDYFLAQGEKINPYVVDAQKVVFTYEKIPEGVEAWDVSADGISASADNPNAATSKSTVVLWKDPENARLVYISSQRTDQEIKFNKLSSKMFYMCANLKSVIFHNVDTSYVMEADRMFALCTSLTQLDLSNWDTSRLNSTVQMFANNTKLEKIYVGNSDIHFTKEEGLPDSLYVTPKYSAYYYYDPSEDQITDDMSDEEKQTITETQEANKLSVDSFNFSLLYTNGNAEDITLTSDDIESFSPEYPNFGDTANRSGKLNVTIKLKSTSQYYQYTEKNGDSRTGELHVTIKIIDPLTVDTEYEVDEHPTANVSATDTSWGMYLSVLKADASEADTQSEETLEEAEDVTNEKTGIGGAEFTVYAATDLKNYYGVTIVKEGEILKKITSIDSEEDDGGRAGTDLLPFDYYAVDKNAKNLYKIVETKAPDGYALPSDGSGTAYVPNLDYRSLSVEDTLAQLKESLGDKLLVKYSKEDNAFSIGFTFFDKKASTITKYWGEEGKQGFVEEGNRPDHITIRMYRDVNKTQLYKEITLNKENEWTYAFDTDIDLSRYYYEEDTSNFPEGVEIDTTDYAEGYSKTSDFVKFYNKWSKREDHKVVLSVHKTWKDNNNADGKRPREITVRLYQNGNFLTERTLSPANNWSYTMEKKDALPKYNPDTGEEYDYKWEEETDSFGDDYELVSEKTETSEDTQYTYKTTELINAYSHFTTASVAKNWTDEDNLYEQRPEGLVVHLLADGKKVDRFTLETTDSDGKTTTTSITDGTVTLDQSNNWKAKAVGLQKYNGNNRIQYTWEEETPDGYKQLENSMSLENEDAMDECFVTKLNNQYEAPHGRVTVSKVIPVSSTDFRHGNITFKFHLVGSTIHKAAIGYEKSVTFSPDALKDKNALVTIDGKKYVKLSVTFEDLDWGSYTITESGSESRYQFDKIDGLKNATIGTDRNGNATINFKVNKENLEFTGTYHNRTIPASIKLIKYGKSGIRKLQGVTFKIEKKTSDGNVLVKTDETNENGEVLFDDLEPGDYLITETKTLKGYTLLKEPIEVTLPLTLTPEEVEERKADVSQAVYDNEKKLYFFYNLTYKIRNHADFEVPHTGFKDSLKTYLPIVAAMFLVVGSEVFISVGGKKKKKVGKHSK